MFQNQEVDDKMKELQVPEKVQDWFYYFTLDLARRTCVVPKTEPEWETFLKYADDAFEEVGGGFVETDSEAAANVIFRDVQAGVEQAEKFLNIALVYYKPDLPNKILLRAFEKLHKKIGYGLDSEVDWDAVLRTGGIAKYRDKVSEQIKDDVIPPCKKYVQKIADYVEFLQLQGIDIDNYSELMEIVSMLPKVYEIYMEQGQDVLSVLMESGNKAVAEYAANKRKKNQLQFWKLEDVENADVVRRELALRIVFDAFAIKDTVTERITIGEAEKVIGVQNYPTSRLLIEVVKSLYVCKYVMVVEDVVNPLISVLKQIGD